MARSGPAELVLVWHGESVGNLAAEAAGEKGLGHLDLPYRDADTPLSENGVEQARALGRVVADGPADTRPEVVLGSPYVRAASTMTHALEDLPDAPRPPHDERLRERDLGLFDGLTGHGIREAYPQEAARRGAMGKFYYRPPGGESWTDVVLRVRSLLTDVRAEHEGRRVRVFTHQAVIMAFRYVLESLTEDELLRIDGEAPLGNCSDALGTAFLTAHPTGLRHLAGRAVLTPNLTELAKVLHEDEDDVGPDLLAATRRAASATGLTVLSGAAVSYVTDATGEAWSVDVGAPGAAVAGSGDVKAGAVAGMLAQGAGPVAAAVWGAYLHARAGVRLTASVGRTGFLAREVSAALPAEVAHVVG